MPLSIPSSLFFTLSFYFLCLLFLSPSSLSLFSSFPSSLPPSPFFFLFLPPSPFFPLPPSLPPLTSLSFHPIHPPPSPPPSTHPLPPSIPLPPSLPPSPPPFTSHLPHSKEGQRSKISTHLCSRKRGCGSRTGLVRQEGVVPHRETYRSPTLHHPATGRRRKRDSSEAKKMGIRKS